MFQCLFNQPNAATNQRCRCGRFIYNFSHQFVFGQVNCFVSDFSENGILSFFVIFLIDFSSFFVNSEWLVVGSPVFFATISSISSFFVSFLGTNSNRWSPHCANRSEGVRYNGPPYGPGSPYQLSSFSFPTCAIFVLLGSRNDQRYSFFSFMRVGCCNLPPWIFSSSLHLFHSLACLRDHLCGRKGTHSWTGRHAALAGNLFSLQTKKSYDCLSSIRLYLHHTPTFSERVTW